MNPHLVIHFEVSPLIGFSPESSASSVPASFISLLPYLSILSPNNFMNENLIILALKMTPED